MHPVITPHELAALLSGPEPPTVADVRWSLTGPPGRVDYSVGHLPARCSWTLTPIWLDRRALEDATHCRIQRRYRPPCAPQECTRRRLSSPTTRPTVRSRHGCGGCCAGRGTAQSAVLYGGIAAWRAAGLPVTREVPQPRPGTFTVRLGGMPVLDATRAAAGAQRGAA